MRRWKAPPNNGYVRHFEPAGIYAMLAKFRLVNLIRWLEYRRFRKAFKGIGTVSLVAGSICIDIAEA